MATFQAAFSANANAALRLTVNVASQDVVNNQSTLSWSLALVRVGNTSQYRRYHDCVAEVVIGGVGVWGQANLDYDFGSVAVGGVIAVASGQWTVTHTADGSMSLGCSASYQGKNSGVGTASVSGSLAPATIPRASTVAPVAGAAGSQVTISIARAVSTFTHTVKYEFLGQSGTVATGVGTSTGWTIPAALAPLFPDAESAAGRIVVDTFSGATLIGSSETVLTVSAPATAVPAGSLALARVDNSVPSGWGVSVRGHSQTKATVSGLAGASGSTPVQVAFQTSAGGSGTVQVASGATSVSWTAPVFQVSGTVTVTAVVTDSRGRTKTLSGTVQVVDWQPPQIVSASAVRCDSAGTVNEATGAFLKVTAADSFSSVSSKNTVTRKLEFGSGAVPSSWTVDTSTGTATTGGTYNGAGSIVKNAKVAAGGYLTTGTWTVRLTLTDVLGGVAVAQATVGTAFTHLSLGGGNTAAAARVAFGKLAELDNTVDNALKLRQRAAAEFNAGLTVTAGSTSLNSGVVANRGIAGLEAGNLFCDPTLAGGGAGWASKPSGVATVTGLTPAAPDGSTTAAQFTMAANTQKTWGQAGEPSTAPGEIWRIRFYVRRTTDGTAGTAGVTVRFRPNRGGTAVYHSVKVDTSALVKNEWKLVEGTVVTPAGCNSAWGYLDASANMAAGEVIQFTNVRCVRAENQPPMMAPALGQLGAVNFEAANDSAWHEEGVGITLERGVWEVEASGSVRTTGNAACWYQLRVFDGSTLIAAGHQYRAHSEGRATDLPVKCRVFVAVDAAKTYSARLNASVDAGSNAAMYFSYIQFTAARRG